MPSRSPSASRSASLGDVQVQPEELLALVERADRVEVDGGREPASGAAEASGGAGQRDRRYDGLGQRGLGLGVLDGVRRLDLGRSLGAVGDEQPREQGAEQGDRRADAQAVVEGVDEGLVDGVAHRAAARARRRRPASRPGAGAAAAGIAGSRSSILDSPRPVMSAPMAATPKVPPTMRLMVRMPLATPALEGSTAFIAGGAHRRHHETHAQAHQHERADAGSRSSCRPADGPARRARPATMSSPAGHERARADAVREPPGDRCHQDDDHGRGQEAHAGLKRRVALDVLHVEGQEEEHRQHREAHDEGHEVGPDERARAEEAEVDHRLEHAALHDREGDQADGRDGEQPDDPGRAPAPGVALDEGEDEGREADGDGGHAGEVDVVRRALVARLARGGEGDDDGHDGHRDVEEEDRLPGDVLDQEAADHRADGEGQGADAGPRADRLAALVRRGRRW